MTKTAYEIHYSITHEDTSGQLDLPGSDYINDSAGCGCWAESLGAASEWMCSWLGGYLAGGGELEVAHMAAHGVTITSDGVTVTMAFGDGTPSPGDILDFYMRPAQDETLESGMSDNWQTAG